jgi:transposase
MRGTDMDQGGLFSYVSMEERVPKTHPLRRVRALLDEALDSMSRDFDRVYAQDGRESVAPERLVRALVLQVLYSIRSERLLCEQLDYNLLFRWFVGLSMDDRIWDHSTFTKNRDRLIEAAVARKLLRRIGRRARREGLLSSEHFSVDGTLIEAWSAVKSMRRRDGKDDPPPPGRNPHVDFHGKPRTNETHVAPYEPQAKLFRKGKGHLTKLYYMAHVLMDHRQGLPVDVEFTEATGFAERKRHPLDQAPSARLALHARCRQSLRHARVRRRVSGAWRHPAGGTEHRASRRLRDRCAHYSPRWLFGQPTYPQAHRGSLRVGQRRPPAAQDAGARLPQRRLHERADDRLPQPGESGEAAARTGSGAPVGELSMRSVESIDVSSKTCPRVHCKPLARHQIRQK